ncbi:MAG: hypothetical protein RLO01_13420 [Thalassobaculaceae bacterium]
MGADHDKTVVAGIYNHNTGQSAEFGSNFELMTGLQAFLLLGGFAVTVISLIVIFVGENPAGLLPLLGHVYTIAVIKSHNEINKHASKILKDARSHLGEPEIETAALATG